MMKLEKRSDGQGEPNPDRQPETAPTGKKPVVVYIMILFIAAFLLMALSFFMHQRSNTEALGELQHSVSAMRRARIARRTARLSVIGRCAAHARSGRVESHS